MRPFIAEAGRLITAEEAERRVLILENPGLPGMSRITQSLYAGLQLILPGEIAHTPSPYGVGAAVHPRRQRRVHVRRRRAAVDEAGRLHPHAVLVVSRSRQSRQRAGRLARRPGHPDREHVRYVLLREGSANTTTITTRKARRQCEVRRDVGDEVSVRAAPRQARVDDEDAASPDPRHGYKLEYRNSKTGAAVLPTIGAYLQLLPKGFSGTAVSCDRRDDFLRGRGSRHQHASARRRSPGARATSSSCPSWHAVSHRADEESRLFSFSDRLRRRRRSASGATTAERLQLSTFVSELSALVARSAPDAPDPRDRDRDVPSLPWRTTTVASSPRIFHDVAQSARLAHCTRLLPLLDSSIVRALKSTLFSLFLLRDVNPAPMRTAARFAVSVC